MPSNQLVLVRGVCMSASSKREALLMQRMVGAVPSFCWAFTGNSTSVVQMGLHDAGVVLELLVVASLLLQRKREPD